MLAAVFNPANRATQLHAKPGNRHFLGQENTLVAEAAAHIGGNHAHLPFRQAQAFGQARAHDMRNLGGGINNELLNAAVPIGHNAAPFHGRHHLAGCADLAADFNRRVFHRVDIHRDVGC